MATTDDQKAAEMADAFKPMAQAACKLVVPDPYDHSKPAWYTNVMTYSTVLGTQVYAFTCKTCGAVAERATSMGYSPPWGCLKCGACRPNIASR